MVPCLYQRNISTKRKLQAWRDQKCIPLVGAITPLTSAGRHNIPSRGRRYRAQNESCLNWDRHIAMVPCLYQGNIFTKRKLPPWRDQKFIPLASRCNNSTYLCGPSQYPISREVVWAQNGKLRKFGCTSRHGTVFAPRKYLYQKKPTGMERPEMYSASRCNNPTYLCGPSKYSVSREAV